MAAPSGIFLRRFCRGNPIYDFINLTTETPSHPPFTSLDFVSQKDGIAIVQSCSGLLLCTSDVFFNFNAATDFYIYNPTSNEFTTLPKIHKTDVENFGFILGVNLAYDPSKSSDYKVICIHSSHPYLAFHQIEIYSSRTGSWRSYPDEIEARFDTKFGCGVYWNGAIHWIGMRERALYLDLNEEKVHEMPMPLLDENFEDRQVEYFGECGGHLNLIEVYEFVSLEIDVYEMQQDHSGWFIKYHVDLNCVAATFPKMVSTEDDYFCNYQILSVVRSEIHEESYLVLIISGEVVRVGVNGTRLEKLIDIVDEPGILSNYTGGFRERDAYLYIKNPASWPVLNEFNMKLNI